MKDKHVAEQRRAAVRTAMLLGLVALSFAVGFVLLVSSR